MHLITWVYANTQSYMHRKCKNKYTWHNTHREVTDTYTHTYRHTHRQMYTQAICIGRHAHTYTYACSHIRTRTHIHTHTHRMYIGTLRYTQTYTKTCIHTDIHGYTHRHTELDTHRHQGWNQVGLTRSCFVRSNGSDQVYKTIGWIMCSNIIMACSPDKIMN